MENYFWGNLFCFFFAELAGPGDAGLRIGAGASVIIFQVTGRLLAVLLPVVPSLWTDMGSEVAVHEEGIAVVAPGTTEIHLVNSLCSNQTTVVEHVAVSLFLRGGGGGDVAVDETLDGAVLEPGRRGTEDKVGGAADITVLEEQPCGGHACIDGVLMTDETTIHKYQTVTLGM